ncbi:hypothetical protein B0T20DRAFT_216133 [Sordaria brevicollis]|uniref:Uncharacterized protein n=1 Tax=Sordaria brevicollis TaxID=83679 RepID=A0AAE0PF20_SORBR|nr:hypothetical protein B0T20DRAFT_216133 [Sordaria brevicollis]
MGGAYAETEVLRIFTQILCKRFSACYLLEKINSFLYFLISLFPYTVDAIFFDQTSLLHKFLSLRRWLNILIAIFRRVSWSIFIHKPELMRITTHVARRALLLTKK